MQKGTPVLDKTDKAILKQLQTNSRIPNSELANKVKLSASACLKRVSRLRREGTIKQFAAVISPVDIGLEITTFTFVALSPHNRKVADEFVKRIKAIDYILECYHVTGEFDYLLKIVASDISAYRDFIIDELLGIAGVSKLETLVVLKSEKQTFDLPIGK
jgi:Lrp/AsnC family leucine-responsive transcriptional regulator